MPWTISKVDTVNRQLVMQCDESLVGSARLMKTNAARGAYVEQLVNWRVNEATNIWGIDRVDQRDLPLNGQYNPGNYDGSSVEVHVLDTGVWAAHQDFNGRVVAGYDASPNDGVPPTEDCQGHGTHVAGTIAGRTYGLAKNAPIFASQVLGCDGSGSTTGIANAIRWVADRVTNKKKVINMSLGGGASQYLDQAVAYAVSKDVTVVVAAGNENQDACNVSPAREPTAITVVASDRNDARASFSNYGTCTDIVAPGVDIVSARYRTTNQATTMSGTSMASPHVAGIATLIQDAFPSFNPQQVADYMLQTSTPNTITGLPAGTPNKFLYWAPPTQETSTSTSTSNPETTETTETSAPSNGDVTETIPVPDGGSVQFPIGRGYFPFDGPGTLSADLTGTPGTDFDLYLWRYVNGAWAQAASSTSPLSTESVNYNVVENGRGYYTWQVASFTGNGNAALSYTSPSA